MIPADTPTRTCVRLSSPMNCPPGTFQPPPVGSIGITLGTFHPDQEFVPVAFGRDEWLVPPDSLELAPEDDPEASQAPNPFAMLPGLTDQEARGIACRWGHEGLFSMRQALKQAYALGASRAQAQAFQGIQTKGVVG